KVRTRGETDEAPTRQLGFDLAPEGAPTTGGRELVPATPAALVLPEPPSARAVEEAPAPAPRVLAVSELVRAARLTLENYFGEVRVEGEVSGFKRSGPGHLYFCLKDSEAQLDCVMYSREATRLKFRVEDGMAVR